VSYDAAPVARLADYLAGIQHFKVMMRCDWCKQQRYVCGCGRLIHADETCANGCIYCQGLTRGHRTCKKSG
jgi:hypothetical protein